ncbi:MAG: VanZ family protein [Acidimicrobiales bacterium]
MRAPARSGRLDHPAAIGAATLAWAAALTALLLDRDVGRSPRFAVAGADELGHLGGSALLGVLLCLFLRRQRPEAPAPAALWSTIAAVGVYGALTELAQSVIPDRSLQLSDLAFDVAGGAAGAALAVFAYRRAPRRPLFAAVYAVVAAALASLAWAGLF